MKKYRYSRLIFLFTALITVMCQCQMTNRDQKIAGHDCKFTGSYDTDTSLHDGTFDCKNPDGSMLTCPYTGQPVTNSKISLHNESSGRMSDEQFWARLGCSPASASSSTPIPTATAQPTATSTLVPTATLVTALLSGDVSACDLTSGFINFRLATISPLVNESDIALTINGSQVSCSFAGSDNSLLSCPLPTGVTFPAQIDVKVANASTDNFSYDGASCVRSAPTKEDSGGGNNATDVAPTACTGGDNC
jgi:hypothetical protein